MSETNADHISPSLRTGIEDAYVTMARQHKAFHAGLEIKPLPPRLWEKLRLQLQAEFRRATGEPQAVLHFEIPSAEGASPEQAP